MRMEADDDDEYSREGNLVTYRCVNGATMQLGWQLVPEQMRKMFIHSYEKDSRTPVSCDARSSCLCKPP